MELLRLETLQGKDETRKILDERYISKNLKGIEQVIIKFINFNDTANGAILVNNSEWLDDIKYIDFSEILGVTFLLIEC